MSAGGGVRARVRACCRRRPPAPPSRVHPALVRSLAPRLGSLTLPLPSLNHRLPIHPCQPQGLNKTYYHVKDIAYLLHEPLLKKARELAAYEKKVRGRRLEPAGCCCCCWVPSGGAASLVVFWLAGGGVLPHVRTAWLRPGVDLLLSTPLAAPPSQQVRRALAKKNRELAGRLAARRPTYRLDHLVRERYPSFVDALRDLDDPLTLAHLFAVLPAEAAHGIPAAAVHKARRLALEWQAWVVRARALRKAFISVKGCASRVAGEAAVAPGCWRLSRAGLSSYPPHPCGCPAHCPASLPHCLAASPPPPPAPPPPLSYYYQAEVQGQLVTWLVPHATSQVLPPDVDYKVMLTFLEFHSTLLQVGPGGCRGCRGV